MESMSQGPYLLPRARFGHRLGLGELVDSTVADGLCCSIVDCHMSTHAERSGGLSRTLRIERRLIPIGRGASSLLPAG
jgi:acetyl-CoA C-acetyltransferase